MDKKMLISISGRRKTITISRNVLQVLGSPPYICLKINKVMDSFIIEPGRQKEYMSFKVPENLGITKGVAMRMFSSSFITTIMEMNGLDVSQTYHVEGEYLEKQNTVVFYMADCVLFYGRIARQIEQEMQTNILQYNKRQCSCLMEQERI